MEVTLIVVGGKANKGQVVLKLPAIIGRSNQAGLTIAHPMVSRQHCEISESGGIVRVRDLGSLNGTFIGQRQIIEAPLGPCDEFSIGPLTFRVLYETAGETPCAGVPMPAHAESSPAALNQSFSPSSFQPVDGGFVPLTEPYQPPSASALPEVSPSPFSPASALFPENLPVPDFQSWAAAAPVPVENVTPGIAPVTAGLANPMDLEPIVLEPVPENLEVRPSSPPPAVSQSIEPLAFVPPPTAPRNPPAKKKSWWPFSGVKGKPNSAKPRPSEQGAVFPDEIEEPQAVPAAASPPPPVVNDEPAAVAEKPETAEAARPPQTSPSPADPALDEFFRGLQ